MLSSLENWVPSSHSKNISYHVSLIVQIKYHSKIRITKYMSPNMLSTSIVCLLIVTVLCQKDNYIFFWISTQCIMS